MHINSEVILLYFEDLDECASSPCVHGTCLDAINNFTCFCKPGFDGILCEQGTITSRLCQYLNNKLKLRFITFSL